MTSFVYIQVIDILILICLNNIITISNNLTFITFFINTAIFTSQNAIITKLTLE